MIIVTGAAGFIGSNLVRGLNAAGHDNILLVDRLQEGEKHLVLNSLNFSDFVDYEAFIADPARYCDGDVQAILHQGACSDTMEQDGRYMLDTNYEYSKRLLDFATERKIPFLYASSASVYGNGDDGFREERACEYPLNVYAFSKFLFDQHVRRTASQRTAQVVGLRYFNVYGPQENHKGRMASVIYHFHNQISEGGACRLFSGSEDFRRDFIFVDDVVAMNLFFLEHPERSGIFNCGTGAARSFRDLADEVVKHYADARVETVPFPDALRGKYQTFTEADLTQVRAAGYDRPFASLSEGVAAYVKLLQATGGHYRHPVVKP